MGAEEKAEELLAIYGTSLVTFNEDSDQWEDCTQHARVCALICVDEILSWAFHGSRAFWQEVREELLKQ